MNYNECVGGGEHFIHTNLKKLKTCKHGRELHSDDRKNYVS